MSALEAKDEIRGKKKPDEFAELGEVSNLLYSVRRKQRWRVARHYPGDED